MPVLLVVQWKCNVFFCALDTLATPNHGLMQGTEAASVVQDWVQAAQARAVAEQTCALLQAHAATLAASLSHE